MDLKPKQYIAGCTILIFLISSTLVGCRGNDMSDETIYTAAQKLLENKQYLEARNKFVQILDYKDSEEKYFELLHHNAIAAGGHHTVGLQKDGTVVAVGRNNHGQLDVSTWQGIVSIAAGAMHTVGLRKDGTVVAVGWNDSGQTDVSEWQDIIAIAAGGVSTVGLKKDGTVVAVGRNNYGETDVSEWRDIVAIAAGGAYTLGLKRDGSVVAVGAIGEAGEKRGQPWYVSDDEVDVSDWQDIAAISAGSYHVVGLKRDGKILASKGTPDIQVILSKWKDIVAIAAGGMQTAGLKRDGTVVAHSYHDVGYHPPTDDVSRWQYRWLFGWRNIVEIAVGEYHIVGLRKNGTVVVAVGYDKYGQTDVSSWRDIGVYR